MHKNCKSSWMAGVVALLLCATSFAEEKETTVKEGAKDAGRAVGSTVREVGQGAKEVGKTIGHAAREGVQAIKEGGREFKKAIKGEN